MDFLKELQVCEGGSRRKKKVSPAQPEGRRKKQQESTRTLLDLWYHGNAQAPLLLQIHTLVWVHNWDLNPENPAFDN